MFARFDAEADGLRKLFEAGGSADTAMQYLMIDRGLYPELAKAMGDAVRGMNPKINYWNTGKDAGNPIADVIKNIPVTKDMLHSAGINPPKWLMETFDKTSPSMVTALSKNLEKKVSQSD